MNINPDALPMSLASSIMGTPDAGALLPVTHDASNHANNSAGNLAAHTNEPDAFQKLLQAGTAISNAYESHSSDPTYARQPTNLAPSPGNAKQTESSPNHASEATSRLRHDLTEPAPPPSEIKAMRYPRVPPLQNVSGAVHSFLSRLQEIVSRSPSGNHEPSLQRLASHLPAIKDGPSNTHNAHQDQADVPTALKDHSNQTNSKAAAAIGSMEESGDSFPAPTKTGHTPAEHETVSPEPLQPKTLQKTSLPDAGRSSQSFESPNQISSSELKTAAVSNTTHSALPPETLDTGPRGVPSQQAAIGPASSEDSPVTIPLQTGIAETGESNDPDTAAGRHPVDSQPPVHQSNDGAAEQTLPSGLSALLSNSLGQLMHELTAGQTAANPAGGTPVRVIRPSDQAHIPMGRDPEKTAPNMPGRTGFSEGLPRAPSEGSAHAPTAAPAVTGNDRALATQTDRSSSISSKPAAQSESTAANNAATTESINQSMPRPRSLDPLRGNQILEHDPYRAANSRLAGRATHGQNASHVRSENNTAPSTRIEAPTSGISERQDNDGQHVRTPRLNQIPPAKAGAEHASSKLVNRIPHPITTGAPPNAAQSSDTSNAQPTPPVSEIPQRPQTAHPTPHRPVIPPGSSKISVPASTPMQRSVAPSKIPQPSTPVSPLQAPSPATPAPSTARPAPTRSEIPGTTQVRTRPMPAPAVASPTLSLDATSNSPMRGSESTHGSKPTPTPEWNSGADRRSSGISRLVSPSPSPERAQTSPATAKPAADGHQRSTPAVTPSVANPTSTTNSARSLPVERSANRLTSEKVVTKEPRHTQNPQFPGRISADNPAPENVRPANGSFTASEPTSTRSPAPAQTSVPLRNPSAGDRSESQGPTTIRAASATATSHGSQSRSAPQPTVNQPITTGTIIDRGPDHPPRSQSFRAEVASVKLDTPGTGNSTVRLEPPMATQQRSAQVPNDNPPVSSAKISDHSAQTPASNSGESKAAQSSRIESVSNPSTPSPLHARTLQSASSLASTAGSNTDRSQPPLTHTPPVQGAQPASTSPASSDAPNRTQPIPTPSVSSAPDPGTSQRPTTPNQASVTARNAPAMRVSGTNPTEVPVRADAVASDRNHPKTEGSDSARIADRRSPEPVKENSSANTSGRGVIEQQPKQNPSAPIQPSSQHPSREVTPIAPKADDTAESSQSKHDARSHSTHRDPGVRAVAAAAARPASAQESQIQSQARVETTMAPAATPQPRTVDVQPSTIAASPSSQKPENEPAASTTPGNGSARPTIAPSDPEHRAQPKNDLVAQSDQPGVEPSRQPRATIHRNIVADRSEPPTLHGVASNRLSSENEADGGHPNKTSQPANTAGRHTSLHESTQPTVRQNPEPAQHPSPSVTSQVNRAQTLEPLDDLSHQQSASPVARSTAESQTLPGHSANPGSDPSHNRDAQERSKGSRQGTTQQHGPSELHSAQRTDGIAARGENAPRSFAASLTQTIFQDWERMRSDGKTHVSIEVRRADGESITVEIRLRNNRVQASFSTHSEQARAEIQQGWEELTRRLAERGARLDPPQFQNTTSSSFERDDARQNLSQQKGFTDTDAQPGRSNRSTSGSQHGNRADHGAQPHPVPRRASSEERSLRAWA